MRLSKYSYLFEIDGDEIELDFSNIKLCEYTARYLSSHILDTECIKKLNLNTDLDEESFKIICKALCYNDTIEYLTFGNIYSDYLYDVFNRNTTIKHLDLSNIILSSKDLQIFYDNKTLLTLNLSNTRLCASEYLYKIFEFNSTLTNINLSNNNLLYYEMKELVEISANMERTIDFTKNIKFSGWEYSSALNEIKPKLKILL